MSCSSLISAVGSDFVLFSAEMAQSSCEWGYQGSQRGGHGIALSVADFSCPRWKWGLLWLLS